MSVCLPVEMCSRDRQLTSSGMLFRVSSFTLLAYSTLLFPDEFSKEALIPTCSPRSEFAETLVASRPEDAFINPIANSILGQQSYQWRSKLRSEFHFQPYQQYCSFPCQSFN